jgi:hypothetical protein
VKGYADGGEAKAGIGEYFYNEGVFIRRTATAPQAVWRSG